MREKSITVDIVLQKFDQRILNGSIYEMSGYSNHDENSFENQELIVPKQKNFCIEDGIFTHDFKEKFITIFRIKSV